jgi:hypothetical protein
VVLAAYLVSEDFEGFGGVRAFVEEFQVGFMRVFGEGCAIGGRREKDKLLFRVAESREAFLFFG